MLIPILDEIIDDAAAAGGRHVLIAMAHRGRLNVLAHVLQKPYAQILAEFKDPVHGRTGLRDRPGLDGRREVPRGRAQRCAARACTVSMPPNPSHLEAVNPVVAGMARAAGTERRRARHGRRSIPRRTLPILIHGDAAFPGQGVVAETLNLSRLDGYAIGGTIHIIANNQLGFTADSREVLQHALRQRPGARLQDPDHPRQRRRSGRLHRGGRVGLGLSRDVPEGLPDRPDRLSPLRPQRRRRAGVHAAAALRRRSPRTRPCASRWADQLVARGKVTAGRTPTADVQPPLRRSSKRRWRRSSRSRISSRRFPSRRRRGAARTVRTAVPLDAARGAQRGAAARARRLHSSIASSNAPASAAQAMLGHAGRADDRLGRRRGAGAAPRSSPTASPIRLTGEDVERGTFSHRHAVFHDAVTGKRHIPLQALPQATAAFEIRNSPLSEARRRRLRVRLQRPGAGPAGGVGSAVRRLHQRRAGRSSTSTSPRAAPSGA